MEQIKIASRTVALRTWEISASRWAAVTSFVGGCARGVGHVAVAMLQWDSIVFLCGGFVAGIFFSTASRLNRPVDWLLFAGALLFAVVAFVHLLRSRHEKSGD